MMYQTWIIGSLVRVDAWSLGDEYVGESTWQDYTHASVSEFYASEQYDIMKIEAKEAL